MAKRTEIAADIKREFGPLLTLAQTAAYLGVKDRRTVKNFMAGVPVVQRGREKCYLAIDIARMIDCKGLQ